MQIILAALALGLAFEGACLALFPTFMRKALLQMAVSPDHSLRKAGLIAIALALLLAFLGRNIS